MLQVFPITDLPWCIPVTPRRGTETQKAYAERTLREDGRFATYDALYALRYEDGQKCAITRLAAIVLELRQDGWQIRTIEEQGQLAVYVLESDKPRIDNRPEWEKAWQCAACGGAPVGPPTVLLGGLGTSRCSRCGAGWFKQREQAA